MKRILSLVLATAMVVLLIPGTVSAVATAPAAVWAESITVDGTKDEAYTGAGLAIGNSQTDDVYGTAYFAHDESHLYVLVEVHDETRAAKVADKRGYVGGVNGGSYANLKFNDGVSVGYHFGSVTESSGVWGQLSASDTRAANAGAYFLQRNERQSGTPYVGRHPFAPNAAAASAIEVNGAGGSSACRENASGDGYTMEFCIPFGRQVDGTPVNVNALMESGIGICVQISDSQIPDDAATDTTASSTNNPAAILANYVCSGGYTENLANGGQLYAGGQGGFSLISVKAEPKVRQNVTAVRTTASITLDGQMDDIYARSTPRVITASGASGDAITATVYFAYDDSHLYVFADIEDATESISPAKNTGNVTPAGKTDAFWLGLNVDGSADVSLAVYSDAQVKADNDGTGLFAIMRGGTNNGWARQGGYAFRSNGYMATSVSTATGYTAEMVIPFETDVEGNSFASLAENGKIAVATFFSNATTDAVNADGKDGVAEWVLPRACVYPEKPNARAYDANDSGENSWDQLTFAPALPDSLVVTASPVRRVYHVGDTLDLAGLMVSAVYYTGAAYETVNLVSQEQLSLTYGFGTDVSVPLADPGIVNVTAAYKGTTVSFPIFVISHGTTEIRITQQPLFTAFRFSDSFRTDGLCVMSVDCEGNMANVTAGITYTIDGREIAPGDPIGAFFGNTAGSHTVTVSYRDGSRDFTAFYEIEVTDDRYQVVRAYEATENLSIDGEKDAIYDLSSPMTISGVNSEDGKPLSANVWFAYDSNYIYVYGDVKDTTRHVKSNQVENITYLSNHDALVISLNVDPAQTTGPENQIYTSSQTGNITEANDASGIFGVIRGSTTVSPGSRSGGLAYGDLLHAGTAYTACTVETETGYAVEFAIPWTQSKTEGQNFYEMAKENGIAIRGTLVNALVDNPDRQSAAQIIHSEAMEVGKNWRETMYSFNNDQTYTWDKMELASLIDSADEGLVLEGENEGMCFSGTSASAADGSFGAGSAAYANDGNWSRTYGTEER